MKTTIRSTLRDGGNIIVSVNFEFPEKEWTADEAETAVRAFTADRQAGTIAALAAMTATEKTIAKQLGVSPHTFVKYNAVRR